MARPRIERDERIAKSVQVLAQYGATNDTIANTVGMSDKTLKKLYAEELTKGRANADSKLLQTVYEMATKEKNVACLLFLCKTRLGMRETNKLEVTSPDGSMTPFPTEIALIAGEGGDDSTGDNPSSEETD